MSSRGPRVRSHVRQMKSATQIGGLSTFSISSALLMVIIDLGIAKSHLDILTQGEICRIRNVKSLEDLFPFIDSDDIVDKR